MSVQAMWPIAPKCIIVSKALSDLGYFYSFLDVCPSQGYFPATNSPYPFILLSPVVQKPINANPRLKINQGVCFSAPKYCLTLIFGKNLDEKKSVLKNRNKQKKLALKS